jgi:hypothetical protein
MQLYVPCTANVKCAAVRSLYSKCEIHSRESPRPEVDFHVTGREMMFWSLVCAYIIDDNEKLKNQF